MRLLNKDELEAVLAHGFFPPCSRTAMIPIHDHGQFYRDDCIDDHAEFFLSCIVRRKQPCKTAVLGIASGSDRLDHCALRSSTILILALSRLREFAADRAVRISPATRVRSSRH